MFCLCLVFCIPSFPTNLDLVLGLSNSKLHLVRQPKNLVSQPKISILATLGCYMTEVKLRVRQ